MVRILYRKVRSRRLYANLESFRRVIAEGMSKEIAPAMQDALALRVANWNAPIRFEWSLELTDKGFSLHVYPTGAGANVWRWVSRGVAGHPIQPRRKWSPSTKGKYRAALKLYYYNPKTRPGGFFGGSGTRQFSGYRKYVPWWPGIQARHFEEHVSMEMRPYYRRAMENIVRRAVTAAKREAR